MRKRTFSTRIMFLLCFVFPVCTTATCQTSAVDSAVLSTGNSAVQIKGPGPGIAAAQSSTASQYPDANQEFNSGETDRGWLRRGLLRGLDDQKALYAAPFKPANFKWDALMLVSTAALVATDRQTARALPTGHIQFFQNMSNVSLASTAAAAGGTWIYGIKHESGHAKETGELELETLANTFLIYTPMQYILARERPQQGTGNGRFWRDAGLGTSFPSGHAMFGWAMATVLAHEYPKPWVKFLAYGAATSISVGRFMGRQHYASDVVVGSVLGYAIATHIFHARCDPNRSEACTR